MNQWENRVAVVAGASSGIGAAIIHDLLKYNLIVVGLDYKLEQMQVLKNSLSTNLQKRFHCIKVDWKVENDILKAFDWIEKTLGGCDIMINNTNVFHNGQLATMDLNLIHETLNVNIMAPIICYREAVRSMQQRNINCHIIMINNVDGHRIPNMIDSGLLYNIWSPTRYFLTAMNEVLRQELQLMRATKIKFTNISPSMVDKEKLSESYKVNKSLVTLRPEAVSQAVLYALGTQEDVLVNDVIIRTMGTNL